MSGHGEAFRQAVSRRAYFFRNGAELNSVKYKALQGLLPYEFRLGGQTIEPMSAETVDEVALISRVGVKVCVDARTFGRGKLTVKFWSAQGVRWLNLVPKKKQKGEA